MALVTFVVVKFQHSEILVNSYLGIPGKELGPEGQSLRRTYGAH